MNHLLTPDATQPCILEQYRQRYYHPVTSHGRAASLARIDAWIESTTIKLALAIEPFFNEDGTPPTAQQKKAVTTLRRVLSRLQQQREYCLRRPLVGSATTGQP